MDRYIFDPYMAIISCIAKQHISNEVKSMQINEILNKLKYNKILSKNYFFSGINLFIETKIF
jgi:hypothetical protein